jgi:hypothetical protein
MKKLIYLFLMLLILPKAVSAQVAAPTYSVYIYNFAKYMSWPSHYQSGDFVIAVLGYTPHLKELHQLVNTRKVGNQNIVLKVFSEPKDFGKCHVLFIPEKQSDRIEECIALLGTKPTVIITEKVGMAKRGSCINFLQDGDKIQFELNRTTALNIGVQVRNDLAKLAVVEIE